MLVLIDHTGKDHLFSVDRQWLGHQVEVASGVVSARLQMVFPKEGLNVAIHCVDGVSISVGPMVVGVGETLLKVRSQIAQQAEHQENFQQDSSEPPSKPRFEQA